jgi:hypothetical protein
MFLKRLPKIDAFLNRTLQTYHSSMAVGLRLDILSISQAALQPTLESIEFSITRHEFARQPKAMKVTYPRYRSAA